MWRAGEVADQHRLAAGHHLPAGEGDRLDVVGQHEADIAGRDQHAGIGQQAGEVHLRCDVSQRLHLFALLRAGQVAGHGHVNAGADRIGQPCDGPGQVDPALVVIGAGIADQHQCFWVLGPLLAQCVAGPGR
ncbi:hypothetical protein G6F63_014247 [Rhizopus arrhizus]|nr:hypothetical protein G6F63_014247 [Rhizopus arrhizus]